MKAGGRAGGQAVGAPETASRAGGRRSWLSASPAARLPAAALLLILSWLVVYPLLLVLVEGVRGPDGWTLEHVREFIARPTEWQALRGSLVISVASVGLAALVGIPLAVLFARYDFPGRRILAGIVALPAVLPPLVGVVAFLFLYGETGFVAHAVQAALGLEEPPWRLEGAAAILLVHAYSMYVYFYLLVRAALLSLDGAQLEAAASLGASRWRTLRRVVLPALRPALLAGAALAFARALGEFGSVVLIAGNIPFKTEVASVFIFGQIESDNPQAAAAVSVVLLFASVVLLLAISALTTRWSRHVLR